MIEQTSSPDFPDGPGLVLPGLPLKESWVMAAACALVATASGASTSVSVQPLLESLATKHEMEEAECLQALDSLERHGFIKGARTLGSRAMNHFRVTETGFGKWLQAAIDYPTKEREVAGAAAGGHHDSAAVAKAVGLPEPVALHFLEHLDAQRYLVLSKQVNLPRTFAVRDEAGLKALAANCA